MHAARSITSNVYEFVVVLVAVDDRLGLDLTVRGFVARIFLDQSPDYQAVLLDWIHWMTRFCLSPAFSAARARRSALRSTKRSRRHTKAGAGRR